MSEPPAARPSYETLYGVTLLDDIHNYYPAVLYDPTRFNSVGSLLHYFQMQTRERFDLFTFGQRAYLSSQLIESETTDLSGVRTPPIRPRVPYFPTAPFPMYRTARMVIDEDIDTGENAARNLLATLLGALGAPGAVQPTYEDVEVAPTNEQINQATSRLHVDEPIVCSVCQDTISIDDDVRRINHCEHSFHVGCIDTWFVRNVHCPVCRHDIRETTNESTTSSE
jgi:hypothetical protein